MNNAQDAIDHVKKKKISYWMLKSSNGKLKGEYEGDNLDDSVEELTYLCDHLNPGKYELHNRTAKQNYRGATVYDFEVTESNHIAAKQTSTIQQNGTMDANLFSILVTINTSLAEIKLMIQANKEHSDNKLKELAKALLDDDDDSGKKQLSPLEMLQSIKGLKDLNIS